MRYPVIFTVLFLAACDSNVTTHFPTVQEARSEGAFERGWLPPILPDSTLNITESNDLDVNIGNGSFQFSGSDYAAFASLLTPAPLDVARRHWDSHAVKGFAVFTYTTHDTLWTLALHPRGEGLYSVEPRQ
jgi:hypothetical protein